jgi:hypothetical protein
MDSHKIALEITRLKIRCEIHDALLAKLTLAMWSAIPGTSIQEARASALSELESIAVGLATNFYSSETYVSFDDSEKALYSDEMREIVEHMKSYVNLLTGGR